MTTRLPLVISIAAALLPAPAAHADRITRMDKPELCVYVARLEVAAYHFFEQGKAREDVILHWHGDETENEIAFVNKTVDEAYAWLASWKESSNSMLSAQSFGDMIYQACMTGKPL
ncbi:MAG TPA: hypothetical protein VF460_14925 [Burkholderiales bacterium]